MKKAAFLVGSVGIALVAGSACSSCSHGAATAVAVEGATPTPASAAASETAVETPAQRESSCQAGSLPRFTETDLVEADLASLLAAAATRPIAVIQDDGKVRPINDCHLPGGPYIKMPGKEGKGMLRPAGRVIFRTDELESACRSATHVIAAFALDGLHPDLFGRPAAIAPKHLEGILVPLPCPSVADTQAAPGCVAKGATGAERRHRATVLWARLPREEGIVADVAQPLELYALVPDHFWGLSMVRWTRDPALMTELSWLGQEYDLGRFVTPNDQPDWYAINPTLEPPIPKLKGASRRSRPPTFYWNEGGHKILRDPVFRECFLKLVDPHLLPDVIF